MRLESQTAIHSRHWRSYGNRIIIGKLKIPSSQRPNKKWVKKICEFHSSKINAHKIINFDRKYSIFCGQLSPFSDWACKYSSFHFPLKMNIKNGTLLTVTMQKPFYHGFSGVFISPGTAQTCEQYNEFIWTDHEFLFSGVKKFINVTFAIFCKMIVL